MSNEDHNEVTGTSEISSSSSSNVSNATFSKEYIKAVTENGEIALGLLLTSVRLEQELVNRFQDHHNMSDQEFKDKELDEKGLGYFEHECDKSNLVESEYKESINDLKNKRNNLVHDTGYYGDLTFNKEEKEEVSRLIYDVLEFLD